MNQIIQMLRNFTVKLEKGNKFIVNGSLITNVLLTLLLWIISLDVYRSADLKLVYFIPTLIVVNILCPLLLYYKTNQIEVSLPIQLTAFKLIYNYASIISLSAVLESITYSLVSISKAELIFILLSRVLYSLLYDHLQETMVYLLVIMMTQLAKELYGRIKLLESKLKDKAKLMEEIMDSVNFGLISVKKGRVKNVNLRVCELLGEMTNCEGSYYEGLKENGQLPTDMILDTFLNNIEGSGTVVNVTKNYLKEMLTSSQFAQIGNKRLILSNKEVADYEVWFKCLKSDKFIFLLKDCSSVHLLNELKMERKFKSSIISKVAHEFKNPLISINELVDQLSQRPTKFSSSNSILSTFNDNSKAARKTKFIIDDIKAYLTYLMLLIKDINFSANKELSNYEKTRCNIFSIVNFLKKVTNCLIRKFNKQTSLKFIVNIENDVPRIINVYEDGLKQVLMNLITNAIKNTHHGQITLTISKVEETKLKFQVDDTGVGMKQDTKNSFLNNDQLGLSIINFFTAKLGEPIEFISEINKGSSFWFTIPLDITTKELLVPKQFLTEVSADDDTHNALIDIISNHCNDSDLDNFDEMSFDSVYSKETVKVDNLVLSFSYDAKRTGTTVYNISEFFNYEGSQPDKLYIIVVDDEQMTRLSNIRLFSEIASTINYELVILEAEDGIECLYFLFLCNKKGIKVAAIFSDQTMNYLDGSCTLNTINNLIAKRAICEVPFYILTAYEDENTLVLLRDSSPKEIFTKPFKRKTAEKILYDLNK
jgi:CheY-like chemotaxis protein